MMKAEDDMMELLMESNTSIQGKELLLLDLFIFHYLIWKTVFFICSEK